MNLRLERWNMRKDFLGWNSSEMFTAKTRFFIYYENELDNEHFKTILKTVLFQKPYQI